MVISYLFYKALEGYGIVDKQMQVYWLHSLLFVLQIAVLALVFRSFVREQAFSYAKGLK